MTEEIIKFYKKCTDCKAYFICIYRKNIENINGNEPNPTIEEINLANICNFYTKNKIK